MRFHLRAATASAHERMERAMALEARCGDLPSYRALLARMWGIYAPLEAALAAVEAGTVDHFDIAGRAKLPWLSQDLRVLGLSPSDLAELPLAMDVPALPSAAAAMGALYVLEGATLGGQIISRQLETRLGVTQSNGGRFFSSYGVEVGENWRIFTAALEGVGRSPTEADRVVRAALETFAAFEGWLAADAVTSPGAGGSGPDY